MPKNDRKRKKSQIKINPRKNKIKTVLPKIGKKTEEKDEKTIDSNSDIEVKKIESKYRTTLSTKKSAEEMLNIIDNLGLNQNENSCLENLHKIFDGFDEIKITPSEDKTHNMELTLNKGKNSEIKFSVIYDDIEEYFEYKPIKINADLIGDDVAFYEELYIPKEDFEKLITKFKNQYKDKDEEENKSEDKKEDKKDNNEKLNDK